MTTYSAVIGVNYGDEGKGLVVDWLSGKDTLVVRANGGAQAGHTVVSPSGARHIFSHFGSGYFHGAATYLGPHFLVSPLQFRRELSVLQTLLSLEKRPNFYLNGRSPVVTPFDMKINQLLERNRGNQKHGSCGVGIFETWHRHNHLEGITVTVSDLYGNREILKDKLHDIKTKWVPQRLRALGIQDEVDLDVRPYLQAVDYLLKNSEMVCWGDLLPAIQFERVVFEGAQGLMLDMENQDMFPHLTPSKTGLKNVLELMPIHSPLHVYYVTRSYATRHGNGPLPHENMDFHPRVFDQTNVTNEFQGSIRTAPLDLDLMMSAIGKDVRVAASMSVSCIYNLVITHLDAFPYQDKKNMTLQVVAGGKLETQLVPKMVTKLEENCGYFIRSVYGSNGPTREHVFKI